MTSKQDQKITVQPDSLPNLIFRIENGEYRIPQFQRDFVWEKSKVMELLDSIYREFPIGSFFLWKAGREHNSLFRHLVGLNIPPVGKHDNVTFILDGQQRSTSLYVTLRGLSVKGTDYGRICFDLKEEKFTYRVPDNTRYVAVCTIWGQDAMDLCPQLDKALQAAYIRCWKTLQTYPISLVEVRDKDLPAVCRIFQRINQSGKRLDRFDLIAAMTFTPEFDLRERFKSDVIEPLKTKAFGKISPAVMTQLMALRKDGQCLERNEFALTTEDIRSSWNTSVDAILLAADTLRKGMGVSNAHYIPYDALLTLLAYYFAASGRRSPPAEHMEWINRWFWRSAFGVRYQTGGPTKTGQDRALFDELIEGHNPTFDNPLHLTVADLVKIRMTQTGSAIRNAFLCLLAIHEPRHLANNSKLDLVNGSISEFTHAEKHHVFPKGFLQNHGPAGADIHSLPNFCFLPAELNKRILDSAPADYFSALCKENQKFCEAAASNVLPLDADSGVSTNDYLRFLQARGQLILQEIQRLCGGISSPKQDERQAAIEQLEHRLREFIDRILTQQATANYWKTNIPQDVRENADKRIAEALSKHPDLKEDDFKTLRRRLDYCNVMDYVTIIGNGGNWPLFQATFRKREDLQRYLSNFSEYRNVVMHSREMTKLIEANGTAALIWFANVLPNEDQGQNDPEE